MKKKERSTYAFTDSGFINLNGTDASLLEVDNLITEGKSQLLGLQLPGNVGTREGPVEDGDRSSKHTLHGLGGEALSIATPLDGHGVGTADVGDDDGRSDVAREI